MAVGDGGFDEEIVVEGVHLPGGVGVVGDYVVLAFRVRGEMTEFRQESFFSSPISYQGDLESYQSFSSLSGVNSSLLLL